MSGCLPVDTFERLRPDLVATQAFNESPSRARYVPPEPKPLNTLTVATFNLKVFGPSKASKPDQVEALAAIIAGYDLVAVQELKDASEAAPYVLAAAVAARSPHHQMLLSQRGGLQPDDRSSQEQYAYFYDARRLVAQGPGEIFDDNSEDLFQREPFVARFTAGDGGPSLVLANVHTRPASAVQEIAALDPVFAWARARHLDADAIIALGDFNAGCSYASPEALDALPIRGSDYLWAIPDDADTNVADSACAYDRVVLDEVGAHVWSGSWGVDHAFEGTELSDHWPVWVQLEWRL